MRKIRREYGSQRLSRKSLKDNPLEQFKCWLGEVLDLPEIPDPTAMVLSTVDCKGIPDSRVVLLKEVLDDCLIFYSNYQSRKALQLDYCHFAAANFYWPSLARQVRVRGNIAKAPTLVSDDYFESRPFTSKISSIASPQSQVIASRAVLEKSYTRLQGQYEGNKHILRPEFWGGYALKPFEIEFWQGCDNRLHDRFRYSLAETANWEKPKRLAP